MLLCKEKSLPMEGTGSSSLSLWEREQNGAPHQGVPILVVKTHEKVGLLHFAEKRMM
jgi:hypothetical protein